MTFDNHPPPPATDDCPKSPVKKPEAPAHTPTPWYTVYNERLGMHKICHRQPCITGETSHIASIMTSLNDDLDKANAAFIIKACNSHDNLITALRDIAYCKTFTAQNNPMDLVKVALEALRKIPLDPTT